ncbi:hypothetical protein ACFYE2_07960 [Kocuria sp. CPCC 205300]|uniref:hypothetical protein n=1 Tax=Kocuria sabuli TaxID=3071448 RepID=UPI0036D8F522
MKAQMDPPVVELPWWLDSLNALAWAGTSLALLVAAYFFWRTHMLRRRAEMRSGQWEALAKAIDQALDAREGHQLQIKMLILVHLARQHEFRFGDAQLLADVNAALARRIVAGNLCSDSSSSPEVVAGSTAFEGEGGARPDSGVQEKRGGRQSMNSLGVIRVEALQQEAPYRSQEERVLLEVSNELQHILSRPQH